jgi:hypothetical protein
MYSMFYIPLVFLALAYGYNRRYYRLLLTGGIPDVIAANNKAKIFIILAVLSLVIVVAIIKID